MKEENNIFDDIVCYEQKCLCVFVIDLEVIGVLASTKKVLDMQISYFSIKKA